MPEGHTVHGNARRHLQTFGGRRLAADSPQGRFEAGAARLDGQVLVGASAHGKHLFLGFGEDPDERAHAYLHVHLGLYGKWLFGTGEPPEPRGAVRVRLVAKEDGEHAGAWAELRGPTACEVLLPDEVALVRARLGADPLRRDNDLPGTAARIARSRTSIGVLLMQQDVVAGVGNVYRAEALFRARQDPHTPGRSLEPGVWDAMWTDLVVLLRDGLKRGRIVTTQPADRGRRSGTVRREDAHYVYKRTGLPCRVCGTPVLSEPMAARTLYFCPVCQAA